MAEPGDGVAQVEAALLEAIGEQATEWMHRRRSHLANLTPYEIARSPGGARVVLTELSKIIIQATKGRRR